ncbi:MAG TPA: amidohydrolase family protein [Bryobacteraceae bacterium]|jgi:predicted TIM-barrel fold metal-dependent hydrolase|nr:amidohydrolase family protein [Bryobacteraceae bacterium]
MIVDCHCHAGQGDRMTAPWNTDAPLAPYLRRARTAGIDKTIVFSAFHTNYAEANRRVARIVEQHPDRLIGFVMVHARRDAGRIRRMVKTAVDAWQFRGIKVHGLEASPTRELCEAARMFALPVLVDVGLKPEIIEMLAPQYRDVNFIVPHLGSFIGDWKAHQQVIDQIVRHPNVFTDTSSVRHYDYIVQAIRRAGPRKVLFGSDGPYLHPGVEIHKIRLLGLSPENEALVLGGNILRLIGRDRAQLSTRKRRPRDRVVLTPDPMPIDQWEVNTWPSERSRARGGRLRGGER